MKFFFSKIKLHAGRIAAVALVFGAAWALLAYFLEYYDIAFIDRDVILEESPNDYSNEYSNGYSEDSLDGYTSKPTVPRPGTTVEEETTALPEEIVNVTSVHNTALLSDVPKDVPDVSALEGYMPTTAMYDSARMTLGKMDFSFALPTEYSVSTMETEELRYVVREEYGAYEAEYTTVQRDRPAVSLYMGHMLVDNGTSLVIIDANGTPLCSIDGNIYRPAYTRDRSGRPLFYRKDEYGKKLYYYHLSDDGTTLQGSDYNDKADGRGLYFDYPADWGLSDNGLTPVYDKESRTYSYHTYYGPISEETYTNAFAFSEGLACVTTNENRGGVYFINQYGNRVQQTFVTYLSALNRYSIWDYVMPASRGLESIGFFYFDHGMTRVRYQIIDNYHWTVNESARVVSDEDKLLRTDGTFFDIPVGYTIKGYSDGMILLEKDGRFGFMDYTGDWITEPVYVSATPFLSGLAVLETEDGRFGMIDTQGNIVLPFAYDSISSPSDGLITVYTEESGWAVYKIMESPPEEEQQAEIL